jgi:hypothetical protein
VLYPRPLHRGTSDAPRLARILVREDGALIYRNARAHDEVLADAGTVRRAQLLPDNSLILEIAGRRPVALPLLAWTPGWPDFNADRFELSGARALLERINVDSWDLDAEKQEVPGRVRVIDPWREGWRSWWRPLFALQITAIGAVSAWAVAGIVRAVQGGPRPIPPAWTVTLVVLAVVAIAVWDQLRTRAMSRRAAAPPTDVAAMFAPEPAGKVPESFTSTARLWTTIDGDLAIVDAKGREARLPGPSRGGVAEAVALVPKSGRPLVVSLSDASGNVLAELPGSAWVGRGGSADRLAAVLDSVGVKWRQQRVPQGVGFDDSKHHVLGPQGTTDFPTTTLRQVGHDTSREMAFYVPMSAFLLAIVSIGAKAWAALAICLLLIAASFWLRFARRWGK